MAQIPEHLRQDMEFVSAVVSAEQARQLETVEQPLQPPFLEIPVSYTVYCHALDRYLSQCYKADFNPKKIEGDLARQYQQLSYDNVAYIAKTALRDVREVALASEIISTLDR